MQLGPFQTRYKEIISNRKYINEVLEKGAIRAKKIAHKTLIKVKKTVGLYVHE